MSEVASGNEYSKAEIAQEVFATLHKRYSSEGQQPLDYHRPEHSIDMLVGLDKLAEVGKDDPNLFSNEELDIAMYSALIHDIVQKSGEKEGPHGFVELDRYRGMDGGGNERSSIDEGVALLEKMGVKVSEETAGMIEGYVGCTFPEVGYGIETGLRIYQPLVNENSSYLELATAFSDLVRSSGCDEFVKYMRGSFAEFRELNSGIREKINEGIENVDKTTRVRVAKAVIGWTGTTKGFIGWQKYYFDGHLDGKLEGGPGNISAKTVQEFGMENPQTIEIKPNIVINGSPHSSEIKRSIRNEYCEFDNNMESAEKQHLRLIEGIGSSYTQSNKANSAIREKLQEVGYVGLSSEEQSQLLEAVYSDDDNFKDILNLAGYEV